MVLLQEEHQASVVFKYPHIIEDPGKLHKIERHGGVGASGRLLESGWRLGKAKDKPMLLTTFFYFKDLLVSFPPPMMFSLGEARLSIMLVQVWGAHTLGPYSPVNDTCSQYVNKASVKAIYTCMSKQGEASLLPNLLLRLSVSGAVARRLAREGVRMSLQ